MWQLTMLALSAASTPNDGIIVDGVAFGPRLTLTCKWFANFEMSRFAQCQGSAGNALPSNEGASIKCFHRTCEQLDAEARKAVVWRKPWGTFSVRIVGRVSLHNHKPKWVGDDANTILLEKVLSVRKAE